jgi:hypothetical protein
MGGFIALSAHADSRNLVFKADEKGYFSFNTGAIKGRLRADNGGQGIVSLIDIKTGAELAYGDGNWGLLSYYRLLVTGDRWGNAARNWPKTARLLPDGGVEVIWPAADEHPVVLKAIYRLSSANTIDLETEVESKKDLSKFELFLSSYFSENFRSWIYAAAARHRPGEAVFIPTEVNPLVVGTYLAFPRDLQAARLFYDGRWEVGPSPVHFSLTRYMAAPLAIKRNPVNGIICVFMSRPEDCFALETPYSMSCPDKVAAHYSLYLSLFGRDFKAGQRSTARTRMVIGASISDKQVVSLYNKFIRQTATTLPQGPKR